MKAEKATCDLIMEKVQEEVQAAQEKMTTLGACSRKEYDALAKEKLRVYDAIAAGRDEASVALSIPPQAQECEQTDEAAVEQGHESDMEKRLLKLQQTMEKVTYYTEKLTRMDDVLKETEGDPSERSRARQIVQAREEERLRLARDMHDGPAQSMTEVMLHTEYISCVYEAKGIESALEEIDILRGHVKKLLSEVRQVVENARPAGLDKNGIVETLRVYVNNVKAQMEDGTIVFEYIGEECDLPLEMQIALFRLVQEGLHNVLKHAEANEVVIALETNSHEVFLRIADNGKGFDPKQRKDSSFGLVGMKERVTALGGGMDIQSDEGQGTTIMFWIPREDRQT